MSINPIVIANELHANKEVFKHLLHDLPEAQYAWKPAPEKWCLLEIICHLYDEEREDFRARIQHVFATHETPMPEIDPEGWVAQRNYMKQNFEGMLNRFISERENSVSWLHTTLHANWNAAYKHEKFGDMTAKMFLANWAAHDYLHIRQIVKLKYDYLKHVANEPMDYAGRW
jgi:hypothetical protein